MNKPADEGSEKMHSTRPGKGSFRCAWSVQRRTPCAQCPHKPRPIMSAKHSSNCRSPGLRDDPFPPEGNWVRLPITLTNQEGQRSRTHTQRATGISRYRLFLSGLAANGHPTRKQAKAKNMSVSSCNVSLAMSQMMWGTPEASHIMCIGQKW